MLRLHGFPVSNYYNKVRFILLEKGLPFEEVRAAPSRDEAYLKMSPMAKIPVLEVDGRFIFESAVMLEYLESQYPETPMIPRDPFEAALCRECMILMDWYLDQSLRPFLGPLRRGETPDARQLAAAEDQMNLAVSALKRIAKLSPYMTGANFSAADITAWSTLPLFSDLAQRAFGRDPLAEIPGLNDLIARVGERPAAQKVERARRAAERARDMANRKG